METVTLGVVGDCRVGKTLLVVSYTANYVYQDYKPTAINCYWTNLAVNGCIVDLRIWDNSGAHEYVKLRPLSYPQTECFLICFSLQSRASFENIERKWVPEIQSHTNAVPFLIVGCKRDASLEASANSVVNIVTTEEGEELARKLGAVKYVETSAYEQSGFTGCFMAAVKAALKNKTKPAW